MIQIEITNFRTSKKLDVGYSTILIYVDENCTDEVLEENWKEFESEYDESYPQWYDVEDKFREKLQSKGFNTYDVKFKPFHFYLD